MYEENPTGLTTRRRLQPVMQPALQAAVQAEHQDGALSERLDAFGSRVAEFRYCCTQAVTDM